MREKIRKTENLIFSILLMFLFTSSRALLKRVVSPLISTVIPRILFAMWSPPRQGMKKEPVTAIEMYIKSTAGAML